MCNGTWVQDLAQGMIVHGMYVNACKRVATQLYNSWTLDVWKCCMGCQCTLPARSQAHRLNLLACCCLQ